MSEILGIGSLMGLVATVFMDVWAILLAALGVQGRPDWAMPGRWFAHLFRGKLFHASIAEAAEVPGERAIGWAFHYGVGIVYGIVLAAIMGPAWLAAPTFLPAWIFALLTILAGWCLLHPGMGLGWFASKTQDPWKGRLLGLATHTVFGFGLWITALVLA